jgi:DNA-binding transcriptional MerR regulator
LRSSLAIRGDGDSVVLQAIMLRMDTMPIGQAAAALGLNPSTLRYYEDRGLLHPERHGPGHRRYAQDQLRRLAFLHLIHRLGVPLSTAAIILDGPSEQWREAVDQQIAELEDLIARARGAQVFLSHARECPERRPVTECPEMAVTLDQMVAGKTFEELADEYVRS